MAKSSFGRELGKNAAKYVSNKLFGDKWSTPHRVSVTVQKEEIRAALKREEQAQNAALAEAELRHAEQKLNTEVQREREKEHAQRLQDIHATTFGSSKTDAENAIGKLLSIASAESATEDAGSIWPDAKVQAILMACLEKVEEGIFRLRQNGHNLEAGFYSEKLNRLRVAAAKRRRRALPLIIFGAAMLVIGLVMILKLYKWIYDQF